MYTDISYSAVIEPSSEIGRLIEEFIEFTETPHCFDITELIAVRETERAADYQNKLADIIDSNPGEPPLRFGHSGDPEANNDEFRHILVLSATRQSQTYDEEVVFAPARLTVDPAQMDAAREYLRKFRLDPSILDQMTWRAYCNL